MKIEEKTPEVLGLHLHRLILHPDGECKGTLVFFHGQGDFIDRYPPILEGFTEAGFRCLLTDLPGHGRSPGIRGRVPGFELVDAVLEDSLQGQVEPYLIAGHSMGGLLALRFLMNHPHRFAAAWVSSPLLDPMRQAKPWMRASLPFVAGICPWITVGTGVRPEGCTESRPDENSDGSKVLYHSRISLGWGIKLRDAAETLAQQFPTLPADRPILFTQGELDNICPASLLKMRLEKLPPNQVTFKEIKEARHEPFHGSTGQEVLETLKNWIAGITPIRPQ